jgi:hypothetical protein
MDLANQLIIPKTNVIETKDFFFCNKYNIKDLPLTLEDYKLVSNFEVTTIYEKEVDIILNSTWLEMLGSLILNLEKNFLMYSYKKKKVKLHDVLVKSDSISTSKDLDQISKILLSDKQQSILEIQKECEKIVIDKDAEICRLKIHNQSLLTQIKKIKSDKKTVEDKLEQPINKESLVDKETMIEPMELHKSLNGKNLMVDKAINTNPVNLTTQKDLVDVKRSSHVEVETSQGYEEDSIPSVNQEESTST